MTTSAAITYVWYVQIIVETVAVTNLIRRDLWKRYPCLTSVLALEVLRSLVRAHSSLLGGQPLYQQTWLGTQSFAVALLALLPLENYFIQARALGHRFTAFGAVLISAFIAISGFVVWCTATVAVLPNTAPPVMYNVTRFYELWYFAVVVLYRIFFRSILRPGSKNHRAHSRNLLVYFGGTALGAIMVSWDVDWTTAIGQFVTLATSIFAYTSWGSFRMAGEEPGFGPPRLTPEESERQPRAWRELLDRIRRLRG